MNLVTLLILLLGLAILAILLLGPFLFELADVFRLDTDCVRACFQTLLFW